MTDSNMKTTHYTFLILLILFSACSTSTSKYEVHLVSGDGFHHLITADTEDEALDFIDEQEDSHGTMKVIKVRQ